jgi:hypothetical protein
MQLQVSNFEQIELGEFCTLTEILKYRFSEGRRKM